MTPRVEWIAFRCWIGAVLLAAAVDVLAGLIT